MLGEPDEVVAELIERNQSALAMLDLDVLRKGERSRVSRLARRLDEVAVLGLDINDVREVVESERLGPCQQVGEFDQNCLVLGS